MVNYCPHVFAAMVSGDFLVSKVKNFGWQLGFQMPKRPRGNQNGPGGFLCALTSAGHCPRAWGENKGDGLIGNFYIQGLILRDPGHLGPGQIPVFCNGFLREWQSPAGLAGF